MERIAPARIGKLAFSIKTDEDTRIHSAKEITSSVNEPGALTDNRMGPSFDSDQCLTCYNSATGCPSHLGSIALEYPISDPKKNMFGEAGKWLKVCCWWCGNPIRNFADYPKWSQIGKGQRLEFAISVLNMKMDRYSALKKSKSYDSVPQCCGRFHPFIQESTLNKRLYQFSVLGDEPIENRLLPAAQMREIFARITPETVEFMGRNSRKFHPSYLVISQIPVMPMVMRAPSQLKSSGGARSDERTNLYSTIQRSNSGKNFKLDPSETLENLFKGVLTLNPQMKDEPNTVKFASRLAVSKAHSILITGKSPIPKDKAILTSDPSINEELKGKTGDIRGSLTTRQHDRGRGVISNDQTILNTDVRLPHGMTSALYCSEIVTRWNWRRSMTLLNNGRKTYPGCIQVTKYDGTRVYTITEANSRYFKLEFGDQINRNLLEGELVLLNRQPSVALSNIGAHNVVVCAQPDNHAIGLNIEVCSSYNADFDGDQMTVIVPIGTEAKVEAMILIPAEKWFISEISSEPRWGAHQDTCTLLADMTRSHVTLTRRQAQYIFSRVRGNFAFDRNKETWTGRELISKVLPKFDYTKVPSIAKDELGSLLDLAEDEKMVVIRNGVLLSGVLDKSSTGEVKDSIFHKVYFIYGVREATMLLFNLQQIAQAFGSIWQITISNADYYIKSDSDAAQQIRSEINAALTQYELVANDLYNGRIIPPSHLTVEEYFESKIANIPRVAPVGPVFKHIGPDSSLVKMVTYGARGKVVHIMHVTASAEQITIGGKRPPQKFDEQRSNCMCQRYDNGASSRGFVSESYSTGLTIRDWIDAAKAARADITTKALATSEAGTLARLLVRCAESLIINHAGNLMRNRTIIQLAFGDNSYHPTKVFPTKLKHISISNEAFDKKWKPSPEAMKHKIIAQYYHDTVGDRNRFRQRIIDYELMSGTYGTMTESIYSPIDLDTLVSSNLKEEATIPQIIEMIEMLNNFINRLPYSQFSLYYNEPLPPHYYVIYSFFITYLRMCFSFDRLQKLSPALMTAMLTQVDLTFRNALVKANSAMGIQSAVAISEPITQKQLDAHHAVGDARKVAYTFVDIENLLFARDTTKLNNAMMLIRVDDAIETDAIEVRKIADRIQGVALSQLVTDDQIFYEKFGEPVHPSYAAEKEIYDTWKKYHSSMPTNILNYCFRFKLSRYQTILKNIDSTEVANRLKRELGPDYLIVHTTETSRFGLVIRIHPLRGESKKVENYDKILTLRQTLLNTVINGLDGIQEVNVMENLKKSYIAPDGSLDTKEIFMIYTRGTNLTEIFEIKGINHNLIQTTSVHDTMRIFGLKAARDKIIQEWVKILDACNPAYLSVFADDMTSTGTITSLNRIGNRKREVKNVILNSVTGHVLDVLSRAAIDGTETDVYGLSTPLLFGQPIKLGTGNVTIVPNMEFIKNNKPFDDVESLTSFVDAL